MKRRTFLRLGAAGAVGAMYGGRSRRLFAQDDIPLGQSQLGISDTDRDGTVYVPMSYKKGDELPVLVWLHGFGGSGRNSRSTFQLGEEFKVIVLAPDSRALTWGQSAPGFDDDSRYMGMAFRWVTEVLGFDKTRVGMSGVSDGASYALSMGLAYGDTFNHIMVFSEGLMQPFRYQGKPRIFIAHGTRDVQMPIEQTSRRYVPKLQSEGYDVTYREYDGGHGAPAPLVREGFEWFVKG